MGTNYKHLSMEERTMIQMPFCFLAGKDQATASALIWAERRLLVREALFL